MFLYAFVGVTILFRPLHECTGNWFWWGTTSLNSDASAFVALWRHMFEYYQNEGLNNLLWVYSPAATSNNNPSPSFMYPGAAYVDVVAQDIYADDPAEVLTHSHICAHVSLSWSVTVNCICLISFLDFTSPFSPQLFSSCRVRSKRAFNTTNC